jgi:biopolymer transport protein ExbB/TolQ
MNISEEFVEFALLGQSWVLWFLVALSVLSVGVMIERLLYFLRQRIDVDALEREVRRALTTGDPEVAYKRFGQSGAMAARVALTGVRQRERGADAVAEAMNGEKTRVRQEQEAHLVVLGTLGNNAPFIGLFGTVLGIIAALHRMREGAQNGIDVVGADLSRALVATAVGILVAIPAVIAFNLFQRKVRREVSRTDAVAHTILSVVHSAGAPATGERD